MLILTCIHKLKLSESATGQTEYLCDICGIKIVLRLKQRSKYEYLNEGKTLFKDTCTHTPAKCPHKVISVIFLSFIFKM